jgi:methionyl aminopeptidase
MDADWKKSGEISRKALEYGVTLCKPGVKHIDIVEKIEKKMKDLGGHPSFPVDVSIDHVAAHQTPNVGCEDVLEKDQVVKLDLGAHYKGYVTDNATTVLLGKDWNDLKKSAEEALKAGIEQCTPGNQIRNIGKAIHATIESHGFHSITNLSGHGIGHWIVHDAPTIPNYDNGDKTKLQQGQKIALEPFATNGIGAVKDGKPDGVYRLLGIKPVRLESVRRVLYYIQKEFQTIPFSPRWIKHLQNYQFSLRVLEKEGVIKQYTELNEKSGGMVAQAEKSVSVGEGVLT